MIYAPVVIPTLCRYEHLVDLISSLKNNPESEFTELFIGLDYPANESHYDGYEKIVKYLDNDITGFKKITIIKRDKNYGPIKNMASLLDLVSEQYDRYIFTEDDNIFSTCFLSFMNDMLELIKEDDEVYAVCGYSYPVDWIDKSEQGVIKLNSWFSAWGYGTFFEKEYKRNLIFNCNTLKKYIFEKKVFEMRKNNIFNYCDFINKIYKNDYRLLNADVGISQYVSLENKFCIFPKKSLVRNCGWDGSGNNCDTSEKELYCNQDIMVSKEYSKPNFSCSNEISYYEENDKSVNSFYTNRFFRHPKLAVFKAYIKQLYIRIKFIKK